MRTIIGSTASPLFLLLVAAGCATASLGAPGNGRVITNEPPVPAGGPIAVQPPIEEAGSPIALEAARLVANDGRWSDVIQDEFVIAPALCHMSGYASAADPLAERGVYRQFGSHDALGSWVFVGLALGGDGIGAAYYDGTCGAGWADRALARVGRLAPEVAGRDTSHLFSTARRTVAGTGGATGVMGLGAVVDRIPPDGRPDGNGGRTARPRTAAPAPAPAPAPNSPSTSTPSAAPAKSPATTPAKAPSDDRPANGSGGGDRKPDPVRRGWGSQ